MICECLKQPVSHPLENDELGGKECKLSWSLLQSGDVHQTAPAHSFKHFFFFSFSYPPPLSQNWMTLNWRGGTCKVTLNVLNKGVLVLSASCDNTTTCTALFLLLFAVLLKSCRISALNMKPNQLVAPFPVNHLSCRLLKFLQSCSHLSCPSFDVGFNKKIFLDCHWRQSIKCKRWYLCNGIQLSHWCCFVIPWMELGEIIGDVFPFLSFRWHLNFFF